jgi:hypothetical protein
MVTYLVMNCQFCHGIGLERFAGVNIDVAFLGLDLVVYEFEQHTETLKNVSQQNWVLKQTKQNEASL